MALIFRPAYFEACRHCGAHGRIIFPDGTRSQTYRTKHHAIEMSRVQIGLLLSEPEWFAIKEGIEASDLIDHNEDMERVTEEMIDFQQKFDSEKDSISFPCDIKISFSSEWKQVPGLPQHPAYARMKKFLTQFSRIDESKRFLVDKTKKEAITLEIPPERNVSSMGVNPLIMLARSGDIDEDKVISHFAFNPWFITLTNPDNPHWKGMMSVVDCEIAIQVQLSEPNEF